MVCFPGIMYRSGAEKRIRQYLIDNNFIDCVIQLPSNLFYGTSIATCIMVLKRNKTDNCTLFIDASDECEKVTNNNKLREHHIKKIVDAFVSRTNTDHFARCVPHEEIAKNDYNLSISTYVQPEDTQEAIDTTRKKQYEYYRDKLLSFKETNIWQKAKTVCTFRFIQNQKIWS